MAQAFNNLSHPLYPFRKPQVVRSIRIAGSIFFSGLKMPRTIESAIVLNLC